MRRLFIFGAAVALGAGSLAAEAGGIGISLGAVITGQIVPGVYGQVVIGSRPPPPLVYGHPVLVAPVPYGVPVPPPLYLYVPPLQARYWARYCGEYRACNRPVYFVSSPEYEQGFDLDRWRHDHPYWRRDRDWERPGRGWGPPHGRADRWDRDYDRAQDRRHERWEDRGDHGDRGDHWDRGHHGDQGDQGDHGHHGDHGDHGHHGDRGDDEQ